MYCELRDGPVLPLDVVLLALNLEDRGFLLFRQDDILKVRQASAGVELSEADQQNIRKWKQHLLAVVDYCEGHKCG